MTTTHRQRRYLLGTLALIALAAVLAACGGMSGSNYGGSGSGGAKNGATVSVTEPALDATVTVPFTVKVNSSESLGRTDTGRHHVHIWFDGNSGNYMVVESPTVQITKLSPGKHVMHVSLRNADHSPAGAETQETITVSGGSGSPAPTGGGASTGGSTGNPYGY